MDPLFKKLNYKDQKKIFILNAPDSFRENIKVISTYTAVKEKIGNTKSIDFAMVFVKTQTEVNKAADKILSKASDDAIVWFCYPKKSSKKYTCEFNRDTGWEKLGEFGYEGVRMVAIDQDWSALRFRQVNHIKKITRSASWAMTKEAKARTTNKK